MELLNHLYIAYDLNLISDEVLNVVKEKISEISNLLNSLRKRQLESS
jgi:four helix bundle protein